MPAEEGFQEPEVGEFRIPEAEIPEVGIPEDGIPEDTLADERLPRTGVDIGVDEHPPHLPRQPSIQPQEFSAGAAHWLTILGILVGVWWFFSRSSSSGKTTSGGSSRRGRDAGRPGPDAEELRRKRLEALGSASRSAPEAKPSSAAKERVAEAEPAPGADKRIVEAQPCPAVVEHASVEPTPVAEEDVVEADPCVRVEEHSVEAHPSPTVAERPVAEPTPVAEEGAVELRPSPAVEDHATDPKPTVTAAAPEAVDETPSSAAPEARAAPKERAARTPAAMASRFGGALPTRHPPASTPPRESWDPPPKAEGGDRVADLGSSQASPAEPDSFMVRVQGNLRGSSSSRSVQNLMASLTVSELVDLVARAFEILPSEGIRIRLFFKQKELKSGAAQLGEVGISAGATVQAIFAKSVAPAATPAESQATASASSAAAPAATPASATARGAPEASASVAPPPEDNSPPFSVRAQGAVPGGATAAHVVEGLRGSMLVTDLERQIATAFATGNSMRLRLFYMGRELKDGDATLSGSTIKPGATVQVMFAPGEPRHQVAEPAPVADTGSNSAAQAATAPAAEGGVAEAVALPGDAASAPAADAASAPASPAEAWQALAALEQQLSRINDESEAQHVRQAAMMLKQMLTTLTHDSNPALLQMAQAMVPDLKHIWNFDPTREHLCYLLNPSGFAQDAAFSSNSTSDNAGSAPSADVGAPMPGSSSA